MTTTLSVDRRTVLLGMVGAALLPGAARAAFPDRPIMTVVGWNPGGTSDIAARIVSDRMGQALGQRLVVENRAGASGSIGADVVRRAAPDGYTIGTADPSSHALAPRLLKAVTYDAVRDFTPIGGIGEGPMVVVVPANGPHKTLKDLLAAINAKPMGLFYASSGSGGIAHIGGAGVLIAAGGLQAEHVAYRGGAPMVEAIIKGEAAFGVAVLASAAGQIEGGRLRALALLSSRRHPSFPDIPTAAEAGLALTLSTWLVMLGPPGMPAEPVNRLNAALNEAIADKAVIERLAKAGIDTFPSMSPAQTADFVRAEAEKFRGIVAAAGMQPE